MATFEHTLSGDDDHVYLPADDTFDIGMLLAEEGIVINHPALSNHFFLNGELS
jgi:hypothetical protein